MRSKTPSEISTKIKQLDFKPTVLVEQVSQILADAILEGILKGGDKLVEAELVKQFGISRAPIRESFRELEKRGLVEIIPRIGTFVKTITEKDIKENFPVRANLEGLAARLAFFRLTKDDIVQMEKTLQNMEKFAKKKNTKQFRDSHIYWHEIFINACGNEVLINLLQRLRMHYLWHRFAYQYYQEDFAKTVSYHKKILVLFKNKKSDPDEIENLVRNHIAVALDRFIKYLKG